MAVANQPTGVFPMADKNNSSSNESGLKIMIMNTNGNKVDDNPKDKRKQAIYDVVTKTGPALALFQEFKWKHIRGSVWKDPYRWPTHLDHTRDNNEASIMFDTNEVTVENLSDDTIEGLEELKNNLNPRMCIRKVTTKGVPIVKFICISWHGRSSVTLEVKQKEFKSILAYIIKLSQKLVLPVLLAGDFNVKIPEIETLVLSPLILHKYKPRGRREPKNIIDFFITSKSLVMSDINALSLTSATTVEEVLKLFNHDPVVSFMTTKTEDKDSLTPEMERLSLSSKTSDTDTTSDISAKVED